MSSIDMKDCVVATRRYVAFERTGVSRDQRRYTADNGRGEQGASNEIEVIMEAET